MDQYRVGEFRDTFIEMFRTVETSVHNPMRRAFLVFEEGDLDGNSAFWAEDEEDGAEGFLDALEDVFWTWDDLVENFTEQKREKEKARSRHSAVMKDVIVHRQQMIPKFCWSMFQQLRCETHIIPTLLPFQPNTARCSSAKLYNGSSQKLRLRQMLNGTSKQTPHHACKNIQWVEAKISANLSILKQYRKTFEVDPSCKHVLHDDKNSEFANSTFCASMDMLSVSAMLSVVSIACMDETYRLMIAPAILLTSLN